MDTERFEACRMLAGDPVREVPGSHGFFLRLTADR